jgi:hypothetical protein
MGYALSGAAGAAAGSLEDILKQKFLEQIQKAKLAEDMRQADMSNAVQQRQLGQGDRRIGLDERQLGENVRQFDAGAPLRQANIAHLGASTDELNRRPVKPTTQPVMRISRAGKMEQVGDAPAGAHFVNEPAPSTVNLTTDNANKNLAMKLADDYTRDAKDYTTMNSAMRRVVASANQPSAAGDMALLYSYMKILDPNSVVRETEFAQAAQSGSLPQQIQGAATKVLNGQRLTPEQRTDFVNRARALYGEADKSNKSIRESYTQRARKFGVDPSLIFTDIGAPEPTTGGGVGRVYYDANGNPIKK